MSRLSVVLSASDSRREGVEDTGYIKLRRSPVAAGGGGGLKSGLYGVIRIPVKGKKR